MSLVVFLLACADPSDVGGKPTGEDDTADTGTALPCERAAGAPAFALSHGTLDGYLLVPWYDPAGDDAGVVILDGRGCAVWSADAGTYPTSAHWNGNDVWYNQMGETQALHRVNQADGDTETIDTPLTHHDFWVHPDGTLAWLEEETRNIDGEVIRGDLIRERDPDGELQLIWNAFDRLPIDRHAWWDLKDPHDWTHANGMSWIEQDNAYVVSLYWTSQIVEMDRATGATIHLLDGDDTPEPFGPQHGPSLSPRGLRMFDNSTERGDSRLLEVDWDGSLVWEWSAEDDLENPLLGDLKDGPDGQLLASYGALGMLLAIDESGEETWRIQAPGLVIGRFEWRASLLE